MAGFDLRLEQKQKLIMTPELRQAIKILQLSSLELAEYINQIMLDNPLLDTQEEGNSFPDRMGSSLAELEGNPIPECEENPIPGCEGAPIPGLEGNSFMEKEGSTLPEPAESLFAGIRELEEKDRELDFQKRERERKEFDWQEYLRENGDDASASYYLPPEEREDFRWENMLPGETSLQDYLLFQLGCLQLDAREQEIGEYLIGNLDSHGYLRASTEQIAQDLKIEPKLVEKILQLIQGFEPSGVGARNLQECLLIQLQQKNLSDPALFKIVQHHLEELAQGKYGKVAAALKLPVGRVQELADLLKELNPKPGSTYSSGDRIRYIVPDVIIERVADDFVILVNDSLVPHLTINKTYSTILKNKDHYAYDQATRIFVENKMNQALWLIRSIEQRRMTIYRVTEALLQKQLAFFRQGIMYLRPLTIKEVADAIGMHESTVSRAVSHKYVQTPHGLFEFKFFFSTGFHTTRGESTSAESIKQLIVELLKNESPAKPYSDQKLTELLREKGVLIARRTVSKYREELGILSASQRRRY